MEGAEIVTLREYIVKTEPRMAHVSKEFCDEIQRVSDNGKNPIHILLGRTSYRRAWEARIKEYYRTY